MAVDTAYVEALNVHAVDDRRVLLAAVGSAGVATADALKVTAGTGLTCVVAAGWAAVDDGGGLPGVYPFGLDAADQVTIAAGDTTNPRWDLVCARVRDTAYSDPGDDKGLVVVAGTPSASPADPALPDRHLALARVAMPAGAGSVSLATITDLRTLTQRAAAPRGRVASVSPPASWGRVTGTFAEWSGSEVTFVTEPGRRYRLDWTFALEASATGRVMVVKIMRDDVTQIVQHDAPIVAAGTGGGGTRSMVGWDSPPSGAHTWSVYAGIGVGAATTWTLGSRTDLVVTDVGGTVV